MKFTIDLSPDATAALKTLTVHYNATQKSIIEAALLHYADGRRSLKLKQLKTPEAKLRQIRAILDGINADE